MDDLLERVVPAHGTDGILKVQEGLDREYLARWIADLSIEEQWEAACALAGIQ